MPVLIEVAGLSGLGLTEWPTQFVAASFQILNAGYATSLSVCFLISEVGKRVCIKNAYKRRH